MRHFFLAITVFLAAAAIQQTAPAHATQAASAEPGQAQVQAGCTGCHDLQVIADKHFSAAKWDEVVADMIGRGAPIDEADKGTVVGYLARHYGEAKQADPTFHVPVRTFLLPIDRSRS